MKKINFKAVLMLLMALILVFALVACDKTPPPEPDPEPDPAYTPAEYFTTLWDLTSNIGNESIAESDDIALHADLALDLSLQNINGQKTQNISVGLGLDIVLDRKSTDSHNSAIKLNAYDPDNGENWFTGYFFFNDPNNLYLDIAGSHVAIPFDYKNDTYAGSLHKLIFEDVFTLTKDKNTGEPKVQKTIDEIINMLTKGMGANWSLDNLIDGVLKLTGLDLKAMIESDPEIGGLIKQFISTDQLFDEDGDLKIKEVLTSDIVSGLFLNTQKTTSGDKTTYSTQLNTETISAALSLAKIEGLDPIINKNTPIKLEFAQKGQDFDHLTLSIGLTRVKATDSKGNKNMFPVVALTINAFEVRKATAEGNTLGADRTKYSSEIAFEEEVEVDIDGITLNPSAFGADIAPIKLSNVKVAVGIKGKVDLKNKDNNGTFANAWVRLGNQHVIDMSFKDSKLALKVDQSVKLGEFGVAETIVKAFGQSAFNMVKDMFTKNSWDETGLNDFANVFFAKNEDTTINYNAINPEFKGAVWENLDIVGGFQGLVDQAIKMITAKPAPSPDPTPEPSPEGGETAATEQPTVLDKVLDTVQKCIVLFDTTGNKLTIKSNDIFAKVVEIGKIYNSQFTVDTVIDAIVNMDASNMLQKFAKFFQLEGLEQGEMTDEEFAKAFLNTIFDDLKGELTIDLSDDSYEFSVAIVANGNVKVNVSSVFTTSAFNNASYVDVAAEYENATDKAGWIVFDMAPQEQLVA